MDYSARKKNTIKEGIASKLESRTALYAVLAVKKVLDGSKKLEPREAASSSVRRLWSLLVLAANINQNKGKNNTLLEPRKKIYFNPENY